MSICRAGFYPPIQHRPAWNQVMLPVFESPFWGGALAKFRRVHAFKCLRLAQAIQLAVAEPTFLWRKLPLI
jgi:hypothetical protein